MLLRIGGFTMKLRRISSEELYQKVEKQLLGLLKERKYNKGDKIPSVLELSQFFGVSRSTILAALKTLSGRGVIDLLAEEGAIVTGYTPKRYFQYMPMPQHENLESLFQTLVMLETTLVKLAAVNRTEQDLLTMSHTLELLERSERYRDKSIQDYQFHLAVAKASGNPILLELFQSLSAKISKSMDHYHCLIATDLECIQDTNQQHELIMEMILCEDPSGASEAMMLHLTYARKLMRKGFSIRSEFIETD